jgi:hypothetical protein
MRTFAIALLALLSLSAVACKKKVGDACTKGQAACLDDKTELACQDGKLVSAPCKGPNGCKIAEGKLTCDISANVAGDACSTDYEGHAQCGSDNKSKVTCAKGKYVSSPCRGPDGCKQQGDTAMCDISIAEIGDDCSNLKSGAYACSVDKKNLLKCDNGKFAVEEKCTNAKGCQMKGDHAGCIDDT